MILSWLFCWGYAYYFCNVICDVFNLPLAGSELKTIMFGAAVLYIICCNTLYFNPYWYKDICRVDALLQLGTIAYLSYKNNLPPHWIHLVTLLIVICIYRFRARSCACDYIQKHKFLPVAIRAFLKSWVWLFSFLLILFTIMCFIGRGVNTPGLIALLILWLFISIGIAIFAHYKIIVYRPIFPTSLEKKIWRIISHPDLIHNRTSDADKIFAMFHASNIEYDFFLNQVVNKINISRGKKLASALTAGFSSYYIFDDGHLLYCRLNDGYNTVEGGKYEVFVFGAEMQHEVFQKKKDFAEYVNALAEKHDQNLPPYNPKEKSQIILGPIAIVNRKKNTLPVSALVDSTMRDHNEYIKWEAARRNITPWDLQQQHKALWYYYRNLYLEEIEELLLVLDAYCSQVVDDENEDYKRRKEHAELFLQEVFETTETWRGTRLEDITTKSIGYRCGDSGQIYHSKYEAKEAVMQTAAHNNFIWNFMRQRKLSREMLESTQKVLKREIQEMIRLGLFPKPEEK